MRSNDLRTVMTGVGRGVGRGALFVLGYVERAPWSITNALSGRDVFIP